MRFENSSKKINSYNPDDYIDTSFHATLIQLPLPLAQRHLEIIEEHGFTDTEALEYLNEIINKRKEAVTNTKVTDSDFQKLLEQTNDDFFNQIETTIFQSPSIGIGGTAQIKCYELTNETSSLPVAIKYLLTPNATTLSVAEEHDMLREVEDLTEIEKLERNINVDFFRVPHPYFFHQNGRIQCYGMELIDGLNLQDIIDGNNDEAMYEKLRSSFSELSENKLYEQIEIFFAQMHTYCLHGDIKPRNIMLSTEGKFYVIDFGQSILINTIPEEGRDALDAKKDQEVERATISIQRALKKLRAKTA